MSLQDICQISDVPCYMLICHMFNFIAVKDTFNMSSAMDWDMFDAKNEQLLVQVVEGEEEHEEEVIEVEDSGSEENSEEERYQYSLRRNGVDQTLAASPTASSAVGRIFQAVREEVEAARPSKEAADAELLAAAAQYRKTQPEPKAAGAAEEAVGSRGQGRGGRRGRGGGRRGRGRGGQRAETAEAVADAPAGVAAPVPLPDEHSLDGADTTPQGASVATLRRRRQRMQVAPRSLRHKRRRIPDSNED